MSKNLPAKIDVEDSPLTKEVLSYAEQRQRFDRLIQDPNLLDIICSHVAGGGSLVNLATLWKVPYGDLCTWIRRSPVFEKQYLKAMDDRTEWLVESLKGELKAIAMSDIRLAFNPDGSVKPVDEWPDELAKTIQSVEVNELFDGYGKERTQIGYTKKLKFWDKVKALELLGKTMALFIDRHQVQGVLKLEDIIASSYKPDTQD
jgi:Terminase small subunit